MNPISIESDAEFNKFMYDPKWVHIIGLILRPGTMLFAVTLEYTHYSPIISKLNKNFQFRLMNWQNMPWYIISIPKKDFGHAKDIAKKCLLIIKDGIPTLIYQSIDQFPVLRGVVKNISKLESRIFSLENIPNHPVYNASPEQRRMIAVEEQKKCQEIINRGFSCG